MGATSEVERVAAPSRIEFRERYLRRERPLVISGLTDGWSARDWSFAALSRRFGTRIVPVAVTRRGVIHVDPRQGVSYRWMALGEYLARMSGAEHPGLYLTTPVEPFLPELRRELDVPDYCRDARWRRSRLWMGAAGTVAPLHRDLAHNLFVQLVGRKRFWLYHRRDTPRLYPRPLLSRRPNFSRFDPERADDPHFPLARAAARLEVTLEAGEVLFLPALWWHHVRALEVSLSVNFWWAEGWRELVVRGAEAWKWLRRIDASGSVD